MNASYQPQLTIWILSDRKRSLKIGSDTPDSRKSFLSVLKLTDLRELE